MEKYRDSEAPEPQWGLSILVNTLPFADSSQFSRFDPRAVAYHDTPLYTPDAEEWATDDLLQEDGVADMYPVDFRLFANEKAKECILLHPLLKNPHKLEGHLGGRVPALFDTGCSKSFVSMSLLRDLWAKQPAHVKRLFRVRPVPVPHQPWPP